MTSAALIYRWAYNGQSSPISQCFSQLKLPISVPEMESLQGQRSGFYAHLCWNGLAKTFLQLAKTAPCAWHVMTVLAHLFASGKLLKWIAPTDTGP